MIIGRARRGLCIRKTWRLSTRTTFDQRESTGAVKNFGLQSRMYNQLLKKLQKEM